VTADVNVYTAPTSTIAIAGATTFCQGGSVVLTASSGSSYAWSNGAQTQSITVSTSGSYYVTVTNASGCSATSNATVVTVNPLPVVQAIAGANQVCLGASINLSNATSGGTWSSSNTVVATISSNGTVNGLAVGTTTISYTRTSTAGCVGSASLLLTVSPAPTGQITAQGPTSFCAGGSVTLSAPAGMTYNWSNNSTAQAITVNTSGSYNVIITNSSGCSATLSGINVTVWNLPSVAIASTGSSACLGSTVGLTASGAATYVWSTTATTSAISVNSSNTYTVTGTDVHGCVNSASEVVVFNAVPAVTISANGPTVICAGESVTFTATGGTSYVWSNGTLGASNTVTSAGNYYVMVTNAAGCTTQSSLVTVAVNSIPVVAAITGANEVCQGAEIALTTSTPGGLWSSSNNFVATIDANGVVLGVNAGTATFTYTVSQNGCVGSASANVTVNNNPVTPTITAGGPTSVCPGSTVMLFASNGSNYQWNTGSTNPFIVVDHSGTYSVSVTNNEGCTVVSNSIEVEIDDIINPTIVAPLNVSITPNLGCEAIGVALGTPVTNDNCSVVSVTNNAPAIFPIGTTTVTWTVTDASGNTATATQLVNVVDLTAPVVQPQLDIVISTTNYCEASGVVLAEPLTSDNCTENLTITNDAPAIYPVGTTVVTWTVVDAAGNTTTVTQNVTVEDKTAPVVNLQNTAILLDANGNASLSFEQVDNGSYDNCTIASVVLSPSNFDCSHVGNNSVTVTITDANGNQSSAEVNVLVIASDACGADSWNGPSIPEAFTPNGNSINDTWVIEGLEGYNTKQLAVYSRYGTLVYYSALYQNDWDGTLMGNGVAVPDATYYYILNLDGGKQMSGYVYINRVKQ
jgi:gliding motility-associated-like protein